MTYKPYIVNHWKFKHDYISVYQKNVFDTLARNGINYSNGFKERNFVKVKCARYVMARCNGFTILHV